MSPTRGLLVLFLVLMAGAGCASEGPKRPVTVTPPRTLQLTAPADVRGWPGGATVTHWSAGTLLTSDRARGEWVRVTGHFPRGRWLPVPEPRWVAASSVTPVRPAGPKQPVTRRTEARTYELAESARLRDGPQGRPVTTWEAGTRFTSVRRRGRWLAVSGHFPDGHWRALDAERWISAAASRDISPPDPIPRPEGVERFALVDKSAFELRIVQEGQGGRRVLFRTEVGLGMDDCLPEKHGGHCYYTEPGEYRVRWRIFEPDGIDWCIPDSMAEEPEYARDLARGKRCFDGVLGKFALNIGKTYAIHGTRDLDSLGRKASHGCIRARPEAVRRVWRYLREGDRVVIRK